MPQRRPTGKFPSQPRALARISGALDRNLVAYVAAAGTAGVRGADVLSIWRRDEYALGKINAM